MAGNTYTGKNLRIKVDGKTVFHATECSFTTSRNMESIASKDTNGEQVTPGNYTWGVSTNYLVANKPTGSTVKIAIKELLDIYQAGTEVEVQFTTDIAGDVVITGNTFIEGINMTAGTNGVATGDASFKGNGDFVTTVSGGVTPPSPSNVPVITSNSTINITQGLAMSYFITATNLPTSFSVTGTLPSYLILNSITGEISGLPMVSGTVNLTLNAINSNGTGSQAATINVAANADTTPPTAPSGLTFDTNIVDPLNSSLRKFTIHWTPSVDLESSLVGYDIFINNVFDNAYSFSPGGNPSSLVIGSKAPATTYLVKLRGKDAFNNVSGFSNEISVTTLS